MRRERGRGKERERKGEREGQTGRHRSEKTDIHEI